MAKATSSSRRTLRWALILIAGVFFGFVIADSLGIFSDLPYTAVPHGDHSHYVPHHCEDIDVTSFPTREPGPNEEINCNGFIVPVDQ